MDKYEKMAITLHLDANQACINNRDNGAGAKLIAQALREAAAEAYEDAAKRVLEATVYHPTLRQLFLAKAASLRQPKEKVK